MRSHYIYELFESDTGIIRYVGRSHDPARRLAQHRGQIMRCNLAWMSAAVARGAHCAMRVVATVPANKAAQAEYMHWLAQCAAGHPLCNASFAPRSASDNGPSVSMAPAQKTDKWADPKWDWAVYDRCYASATKSLRTATRKSWAGNAAQTTGETRTTLVANKPTATLKS